MSDNGLNDTHAALLCDYVIQTAARKDLEQWEVSLRKRQVEQHLSSTSEHAYSDEPVKILLKQLHH